MCSSLLKYWTVYGIFNLSETILDIILEASEFLLFLKCVFLLLFVSPLTSGYLFVFGRVIQPFLIKREETIETNISSLVKLLKQTIIQMSWNTINAIETETDINGQDEDNYFEKEKIFMSSSNNAEVRDHKVECNSSQRRWSIDSNSDILRGLEHTELEYIPSDSLQPSRHYSESQRWRRSAYAVNDFSFARDGYTRGRTNDFQKDDRILIPDYRDMDTSYRGL